MQRCYTAEYERHYEENVQILTYAYTKGVQSSTKATPFELVLSKTPNDTHICHDIELFRKKSRKKEDWVMKRYSTVARAKLDLKCRTARSW